MVAQDTIKHLLLLFLSHEQQLLASHDLLLPHILFSATGTGIHVANFPSRLHDRCPGQTGSCHDTQRSRCPLEKDPLADTHLILFFARAHTHHLLFSHNGLLVLCFQNIYILKEPVFSVSSANAWHRSEAHIHQIHNKPLLLQKTEATD
jgi:hypothetical protein